MKKNKLSIKTIVAIGIGSAVFMILGRFGSLPTGIPNTNIETAYAFLALMALLYGPLAGFLIGFIGHALKDIVFFGSPWISWVFASGIVGLIIGFGARFIKINQGVSIIRDFSAGSNATTMLCMDEKKTFFRKYAFVFTGESGNTLAFAQKIAHKGLHAETRGVSDGGAITTLGAFHTFRKPCVAWV